MNRARSLAANVLVIVAVIVVLWAVLRGILGTVRWLVNIAVLVTIVGGLLYLSGRVRKG